MHRGSDTAAVAGLGGFVVIVLVLERFSEEGRSVSTPNAWRGAAFDRYQTAGTTTRKIMALSNVVWQAARGNVSTGQLAGER
jgi:hypothetical protein